MRDKPVINDKFSEIKKVEGMKYYSEDRSIGFNRFPKGSNTQKGF